MTCEEFDEAMNQAKAARPELDDEAAFQQVCKEHPEDCVLTVYAKDDTFLVYEVDTLENCLFQVLHISRCTRCMARLWDFGAYAMALWHKGEPQGILCIVKGDGPAELPTSVVQSINKRYLRLSGGLN